MAPEKQLYKFKVVSHLPNFRIGLIVKLIQMMNKEMSALIEHCKVDKKKIYKGQTKIWDLPQANEP
jgi:hypothetical protein